MIIDSINSFERYKDLHDGFNDVYQFIKNNNIYELAEGKYTVVEGKVSCSIWQGDGCGVDEFPKLEAHDSVIDLHILLEGNETIGFKDRMGCNGEKAEYKEIEDLILFEETPEVFINLSPSNFAIFYPKDTHAPRIGEGKIKKAIFKIHF